ncbi:MAG: YqgE/AlgH family protein [Acidobacteriota bacterium]
MSQDRFELTPPVLLIAMPQVRDPDFLRSVVLLIEHTEEGSFGLVLNRVAPLQVREILKGLELAWQGDSASLAHFGGPVQQQLGTVLYGGQPLGPPEASRELAAGLSLTQHLEVLDLLAKTPPSDLRLFLGYAGWDDGQLISEIQRNDWLTTPLPPDFVFSDEPETMWEEAVRAAGVDPARLAWSQPADGDTAN